MTGAVVHIGLTVTDIDRSVEFYRDVLGLRYVGELKMGGEETEKLFDRKGCEARVAYLNGSDDPAAPPVELIQFTSERAGERTADLFRTSISEICFHTDDIDSEYERLKAKGVEFISEPQTFDASADGFGRSRAVYFKDPDGIILELLQPLG